MNQQQLMAEYKATSGSSFSEVRPDRNKSRKPTGWLFPKPYTLSVHSTRISPSGLVVTGNNATGFYPGTKVNVPYVQRQTFTGNFGSAVTGGASAPLLTSNANEKKAAEIQALLKLQEAKINLGVAYAEHKKTAEFVGDTFSAIGRSLRYAKKGKWKKSFTELKRRYKRGVNTSQTGVTSKWLQWQYAVKPLMNDVDGAIHSLTTEHKYDAWVVSSKGVMVHREQSTRLHGAGSWNSSTVTSEMFRGYFVRIDYHPRSDFLRALGSHGVLNPLLPLWEITPWSFVIDWAIPIGDWFEAMSATFGLDFLSGSCTERLETLSSVKGNGAPLNNGGYIGGQWFILQNISGHQRSLSLKRTVYTKSPIPMLPRYKNPVSALHVANGLSLLTSVAKGSKQSWLR